MQLCARRPRFGSKFDRAVLREQPVELFGKRLAVAVAKMGATAGVHPPLARSSSMNLRNSYFFGGIRSVHTPS